MLPEKLKLDLLSAASKSGDPRVIELAAQLAGVEACSSCGYVHNRCRCNTETETNATASVTGLVRMPSVQL